MLTRPALGGPPMTRACASIAGVVGPRASRQGSAFRPRRVGAAENSIDDDPRHRVVRGGLRSAVREQRRHYVSRHPWRSDVEVHGTHRPGGAGITALDDRTPQGTSPRVPNRWATLPTVRCPSGHRPTDRRILPPGANLARRSSGDVGISEVHVGGLGSPAADSLRLPVTLSGARDAAGPRIEPAWPLPLDVVLTRRLGARGGSP